MTNANIAEETIRDYNPELADLYKANPAKRVIYARAFLAGCKSESLQGKAWLVLRIAMLEDEVRKSN